MLTVLNQIAKCSKSPLLNINKIMEEVIYTIYVEYYEGKNWTLYKNFAEILNHRRRMCKLYQRLSFPKINQNGNFDDEVALEKSKYEIQGYINYLLKSKQAYKDFLGFIEHYKYSVSLSDSTTRINVLDPITSSGGSQPSNVMNSSHDTPAQSKLRFNQMSVQEESIDVIGSYKNTDELLENIERSRNDDSDEDF